MRATYGVSGMMEWVALIPTGRNIVRVRFSGGSLTGYGVAPATFRTTNPVVMDVIEKSSYFKRGKIRLLKKEDENATQETGADQLSGPMDADVEVTFKKPGK
ncbi:MAG: hypothetical protein K2H76_01000 [Muribaculaceae bacterium]|nr:hypothetical protein [Muribaculaceae bacterium]